MERLLVMERFTDPLAKPRLRHKHFSGKWVWLSNTQMFKSHLQRDITKTSAWWKELWQKENRNGGPYENVSKNVPRLSHCGASKIKARTSGVYSPEQQGPNSHINKHCVRTRSPETPPHTKKTKKPGACVRRDFHVLLLPHSVQHKILCRIF